MTRQDSEDRESLPRIPLPPPTQPSALFMRTAKPQNLGSESARERPKPELFMYRTRPSVFAPIDANHELLRGTVEALDADTSHTCLRPVDELYWYFGALKQLAEADSPVSSALHQIYDVLCEATYNCNGLNTPQPTRGLEYAHLLRQINNEALETELANVTIELKQVAARLAHKAKRARDLRLEIDRAKSRQADLQAQLVAGKNAVREEDGIYERLLSDEAAIDAKIAVAQANYSDAKTIASQITLKSSVVQEECQSTMKSIHEHKLKDRLDQAMFASVQGMKREYAGLLEMSQATDCKLAELQTQLTADKATVEDLRLALVEKDELVEGTADLQRSHTPRPSWTSVFRYLPEISYVDPKNHGTWSAQSMILSNKRGLMGRSQRFVNEMCHWLQRIQGDCGMSLELARLTSQTEDARLELNSLQNQMEYLLRKEKRQKNPSVRLRGTMSDAKATFVAAVHSVSIARRGSVDVSPEPPKEYILALGSTPEVPQFLRHTGKVRNRHMTKTELERIMRTVWCGKRAKEAHMGSHIALDDYLYEVLKTKFGIQTIVAEWGYNILHSLKMYSWDSEVDLFLLSVTGAVSEAIYEDQEAMLAACKHVLLRLNETYLDPELKIEPKRVYLKDALLTLHNFFPLKTPLQLKSIEKALIFERLKTKAHAPADEALVLIEDLIPSKSKPKRGYFLKTLRTQHFKEIQDYLALLERKLHEADVNNSGRVEIERIKRAMQALDPNVTNEWTAECILRGIPKRLVGHVDLSSVVEYPSASVAMQHDGAAMRTLLTASNQYPNTNGFAQRQVAPPVEAAPRAWPLAVHNDPDIEQLDADGMYIVCRICSELDKARNGSRIVRMNAPFRVAAWERHKARNSAHRPFGGAKEATPSPYVDLMASYPELVPQNGTARKPQSIAPSAPARAQQQVPTTYQQTNPQPMMNMQGQGLNPYAQQQSKDFMTQPPQQHQQLQQMQQHHQQPQQLLHQQLQQLQSQQAPAGPAQPMPSERMHPIVPIKRPPPPADGGARKKKKEKPIEGCMSREMIGTCPGAIPFEKCQAVQAHLKAFQRFIIPAPTFGIYYNEETQWYQVYSRVCAREPMLNRRPSRGQACEACYQLYSDRQRLMWKRITNMEGLLGAIETIKATNHADMDTAVLVRFLQGKACLYTAEGLQVRQTSKKALEYLTERRRLLEDLEFRTSGTQLI
ncbi:hypothetical protein ACHHYP_09003 [Achlya hypogyna]|uniref:EF-hand domain-containing protein n=1 Tax=Achlya hypogyna TaxID=1202772 RepID=A0A1V9ZJQ9_ACHHY|nr:hypothetical protein ACHHYP_09003 [Achlya hypogyna]